MINLTYLMVVYIRGFMFIFRFYNFMFILNIETYSLDVY